MWISICPATAVLERYGATQFAKHSETNVLDKRNTNLLFIEFVVENIYRNVSRSRPEYMVRHTHTLSTGWHVDTVN